MMAGVFQQQYPPRYNKVTVPPVPHKRTPYPEPQHDCYVEFPGGWRSPEGYIAPAQYTGRKSGAWMLLVLWAAPPYHRHNWAQWVHGDRIRTIQEVEDGNGNA